MTSFLVKSAKNLLFAVILKTRNITKPHACVHFQIDIGSNVSITTKDNLKSRLINEMFIKYKQVKITNGKGWSSGTTHYDDSYDCKDYDDYRYELKDDHNVENKNDSNDNTEYTPACKQLKIKYQ